MSFLIMGAMLPGILSTFYPLNDRPWMKPLPIVGQYAIALDVLGGKVPPIPVFVTAALFALALASVFLWLAARLFSSEKIILGR